MTQARARQRLHRSFEASLRVIRSVEDMLVREKARGVGIL
jgi:hypothetical protein